MSARAPLGSIELVERLDRLLPQTQCGQCGYAGCRPYAEAMASGEPAQFDAFVRFIEADAALLKALKARKWADFAKLYNGPAYARNLYDVKLQRAFERYSATMKEVA